MRAAVSSESARGLLTEHVQVVFDGQVDERFADVGRHDQRECVGVAGLDGRLCVRVTPVGGESEQLSAPFESVLVRVDGRDDLDGVVGLVRRQKIPAPRLALVPRPDENDPYCHART